MNSNEFMAMVHSIWEDDDEENVMVEQPKQPTPENVNKTFEACICLYSNHYFAHGGKYSDKFTSKQSREFNEWMSKKNTKFIGDITNWQVAVGLWEVANPDCKYPRNRKVNTQPHYESMTDYRSE